jgi:hypothetical protein
MTRGAAIIAVGLLGLALSACSLAGPATSSFPSTTKTVAAKQEAASGEAEDSSSKSKRGKRKKGGLESDATPADPAAARKAASRSCRDSAREKGIKSVLSILTHLRPGAIDEEYAACMKSKGYEVTE